mmetsp:Transcript_2201/g.6518  ORF Transcript_2201/g.6518 Transcript_2201/m.6518 type:complete len:119 (-) Transcript_2201:64-420(-)
MSAYTGEIDPATGETILAASAAPAPAPAATARRRNRTNYRCSKCGQPKRGHVCPYQPRILKQEGEAVETRTIAIQVEIDERLAVRHLALADQGLPASYGEAAIQAPPPPPSEPPPVGF